MKKRFYALFLVAVMAFATMFGAGCNNKDNGVIKDGKTVNVKVTSAGYGTTFVTALAEKFNEIYADNEGYKINVLPAQTDLGNTNLLQDIYSDSGVDVYWTGVTIKTALEGEYGECLVDLTDLVYSKPAIKFDGTEESKTIKQKVEENLYDISKINTVVYLGDNKDLQGHFYGIPTSVASAGFAVNTRVLSEYGFDTIPKTTNEMWEVVEKVMEDAATTRVFPFSYSISGNGYTSIPLKYWLAQYLGQENWDTFWSMQDKDGNNLEKPYEVFEMDGVEQVLTEFFRMYDYNIGSDGSKMQDFTAAQAQIMLGDAIFMATGSWMYNEEHIRYADYIDDITFVKIPVISALGEKLFADDFGGNKEKCDQLLSKICLGVDENKDYSVIKSEADAFAGVTLSEEDVKSAIYARGVVQDRSGSSWYLSSKVDENIKEIATLFLRMCASEDGAKLMAKETSETQFFALTAFADSDEPWFKGTSNMLFNKHVVTAIATPTGYRAAMGGGDSTFPKLTYYPVNYVLEKELSIYDDSTLKLLTSDISKFENAAKDAKTLIYNSSKENVEKGIWKLP